MVTRPRMFALVLAVALQAGSLRAQESADPHVARIPETVPAEARARLGAIRQQLLDRVAAYNQKVLGFTARCGQVPAANTALVAACGAEYQSMTAEAATLIADKKQFGAQVSSSAVTDPSVVDARNVPSGLPKSVEAAIPATPAGARVRKGFQAIAEHDWKVARACFQDALNHDPGNAGIQRLIDLAEFTLQRGADARADKAALAALDRQLDRQFDEQMNADLAKAFDDYHRVHPEPPPAPPGSSWNAFFDALFKR